MELSKITGDGNICSTGLSRTKSREL